MQWHNKKVLVTGGAGFIGSALIKNLCKMDVDITVIDNFSFAPRKNIPSQCRIIEGNVIDANIFRKVGNVDYVFHFGTASSVRCFIDDPLKYVTETTGSLVNVFEFAKEFGIKKVIYPSSGTVYGRTPLPQSEVATVPRPINLYGISKLSCEFIARYYSNIPNVGLRIFAGYGPEEKHKGKIASVVTLFLNDIIKNRRPVIWGDGTQSRDFVYIDDIVEVIIKSAQNDFTGIVNVGTGVSYMFNEVAEIINKVFGKNVRPRYIEKPTNYYEHTLPEILRMKAIYNISPTYLQSGLEKYKEALENNF